MARAASSTSLWRYALAGAGLGLTWAVYARAWMRYVSIDPAFTWSGTGFILGAGVVAGACLGVVEAARRSGRTPWWRVVGIGGIGLGGGAGSLLVPVVLLAGWGLARRGPRWASVAAVLLPAAALVALVVSEPVPHDPVPHDPVLSVLGLLVMVGLEAAGVSVLFRVQATRLATDVDGEPITLPAGRVPSPRRARRVPRRDRALSR